MRRLGGKMKANDQAMLYKKLILYSEILPEEFEKLVNISRVCHLKEGEYFQRAGERPNKFGFVVSGILRLYYTSPSILAGFKRVNYFQDFFHGKDNGYRLFIILLRVL
jgi:CRP-like cAMP-binding protein